MKTILLSILFATAIVFTSKSEPPSDELVRKLTDAIRKECPEAAIQVTNNLLIAKQGTMIFTVHGHSKTGEINSKPHQEEGPNSRGFYLTVGVESGAYEGQAMIPQELRRPYFQTYIDGPPTANGKNHYWVTFSYGSQLDQKIKRAIFDALPKTKFPDNAKTKK